MSAFAPGVLKPYLTNWPEVVRYFIHTADGTEETTAVLARLRGYEGVREATAKAPAAPSAPMLPMHFCKGDTTLRLFTTIANLGTPQDITLQELRIESFFPMDSDTANVLRAWAVG